MATVTATTEQLQAAIDFAEENHTGVVQLSGEAGGKVGSVEARVFICWQRQWSEWLRANLDGDLFDSERPHGGRG